MRVVLVVVMGLVATACSDALSSAPREVVTWEFCRETNAHPAAAVLVAEGWEYVGILHQNGINCSNTLWRSPPGAVGATGRLFDRMREAEAFLEAQRAGEGA